MSIVPEITSCLNRKWNLAVNAGECDGIPVKTMMNGSCTVQELPIFEYRDYLLKQAYEIESALDAFAWAPLWSQELAGNGLLYDLTELAEDPVLTTDDTRNGLLFDYFPSYLEYAAWFQYDLSAPGMSETSKLLALPATHTGITQLCYRKDFFEKYGLRPPRTWEEFARIVQEYTDPKQGIYGTVFPGKRSGLFPVLNWFATLTSMGGVQMVGTPGEKNMCSTMSSEIGMDAYIFWQSLLRFMPPESSEMDVVDAAQALESGRVLMLINVSSFVFPNRFCRPENFDKIGFSGLPGVGSYTGAGYGGGWSWSIPANARNPRGSWQLIQHLCSSEADRYKCIHYGLTPARRSTFNDPDVLQAQPWLYNMQSVMERSTAPAYFYIPQAFEIAQEINKWLIPGILSTEPETSCLRGLDAQINACLRQNNWRRAIG